MGTDRGLTLLIPTYLFIRESENSRVTEQEKGVEVVEPLDQNVTASRRTSGGRHAMSTRFLLASAVAKLGPRDGNAFREKERGEMKERTSRDSGLVDADTVAASLFLVSDS